MRARSAIHPKPPRPDTGRHCAARSRQGQQQPCGTGRRCWPVGLGCRRQGWASGRLRGVGIPRGVRGQQRARVRSAARRPCSTFGSWTGPGDPMQGPPGGQGQSQGESARARHIKNKNKNYALNLFLNVAPGDPFFPNDSRGCESVNNPNKPPKQYQPKQKTNEKTYQCMPCFINTKKENRPKKKGSQYNHSIIYHDNMIICWIPENRHRFSPASGSRLIY